MNTSDSQQTAGSIFRYSLVFCLAPVVLQAERCDRELTLGNMHIVPNQKEKKQSSGEIVAVMGLFILERRPFQVRVIS